jgi:hypothetical protein
MASQRISPTARAEIAANDAVARWKVLLAHNGALPTCDGLFAAITEAMDDVQIVDAPSAEAARSILRRTPFDVCLVCLDLPPSPSGGIRLAQDLVRAGCPLILVTRSLRWLPRSAAELKVLPWIAPEADPAEVARTPSTRPSRSSTSTTRSRSISSEIEDDDLGDPPAHLRGLIAAPSCARLLRRAPRHLLERSFTLCGSSSVGRASASQAEGRGFESRFPLQNVKARG